MEIKNSAFLSTLHDAGVPLPYFIPKVPENHFFYKNGLSKIIPRTMVKVHSDIDECQDLWEQFTPVKKTVYDEWDLRFAWYKGYKYKPYFYTLYEGNNPLAVLPLWYDEQKKQFQVFGSYWMEDANMFVKEEKMVDLLFAIAPTPIYLGSLLNNINWESKKIFAELQKDYPKNIKDMTKYNSMDALLASFGKKERYNLKSDYNHIMEMNPQVKVVEGYDEDAFNSLVKLNVERFSKNAKEEDQSDLLNPKQLESFRNMIKSNKSYKSKFIQVFVQGYLAGIDFVIEYKDVYYTVKSANDINRFKGVGNFLVYYEFEDALKNGYRIVDAQQEDWGWKHRYFDQVDVYEWEVK